jgi:hypothetical protein
LEAKVEDGEIPLPRIAKARNTLHVHSLAASSGGNLEIVRPPNFWVGWVITKYGEKTFKVRFIAAARAPHMAPKQAEFVR